MEIKKNSKQAKLIDVALEQYINFLTQQTEHRIGQFNYQNNFSEIEAIASEHLNTLTDIENLRNNLVDTPNKSVIDSNSRFKPNRDDIPF